MTIGKANDVGRFVLILTQSQETSILILVDPPFLRQRLIFFRIEAAFRQHDQHQILMMRDQVANPDQAATLGRAAIAERQQPGQPAPTRPCRRIGDDVGRAVCKDQSRPDDQAEIGRGRGQIGRVGKVFPWPVGLMPRLRLGPGGVPLLARLPQRDMRAHYAGDGVAVGDTDSAHA
jgi:hypothetical protein